MDRSPYVDKSIECPDAVSEDGNLDTVLCMFRQVEKAAKANQIHLGASGYDGGGAMTMITPPTTFSRSQNLATACAAERVKL